MFTKSFFNYNNDNARKFGLTITFIMGFGVWGLGVWGRVKLDHSAVAH